MEQLRYMLLIWLLILAFVLDSYQWAKQRKFVANKKSTDVYRRIAKYRMKIHNEHCKLNIANVNYILRNNFRETIQIKLIQ